MNRGLKKSGETFWKASKTGEKKRTRVAKRGGMSPPGGKTNSRGEGPGKRGLKILVKK